MIRYCCQYLKEQSGGNTVTILGIRKQKAGQDQRGMN